MRELDTKAVVRASELFLGAADRLTDGLDDEVVGAAMLSSLVEFIQSRWGAEFASAKLFQAGTEIQHRLGETWQ